MLLSKILFRLHRELVRHAHDGGIDMGTFQLPWTFVSYALLFEQTKGIPAGFQSLKLSTSRFQLISRSCPKSSSSQ